MERSLFRLAPRLALLVALALAAYAALALAVPRRAHAQNKAVEAQAKALQKKAMDEDYLSTEFGKASDKLQKATQLCGAEKCSAPLRAQLKRDLGVVLIGGNISKEDAIKAFAEAMAIDAGIQLDPDLKTKDVEEAWEKAKKQGGGGAPPGPAPAGDFTHTPVAMQQIRTPVPIYVEYGGSETLVKVTAKYKAFGMTEWKSAELKKLGKGYGGVVPCLDVIQGELQYYLLGFNDQNDPVATGGDRNRPYKVAIKKDKVEGDAPRLPDQPAPTQCADTGDCPPDFPGCHTGKPETATDDKKGKGEDEDCEEDAQCTSGKCKSNKCTKPEEKSGYKKLWIGVNASIEGTLVGSADDVCKLSQDKAALPLNSAGYYCIDSGGNDYPDRNDPQGTVNRAILSDGKTDKVSGGGTLGNVRLLVSVEYAFSANVLAGVRAGLIVLRYPGVAAANDGKASQLGPVHLEARGTYVIGKDALAKQGLSPYVMVAAGYGEFSGKVAVSVRDTTKPGTTQVDAWALGGPVFGALGGGIRYGLSPRAAFVGGLRVNLAFGNAGVTPSVGPEAGIHFGF